MQDIIAENGFQFQYGSIKRFPKGVSPVQILHFNSNMVRLKARPDINKMLIERHFNSNMVRLKALAFAKQANNANNFNSNMVRLKGR